MKLRRSIYARPEIVRGQQCAEALLDPGGATKQLPARRYLALEGGLTAEPAWAVERRRRRPHKTRTRLGGPSTRSLGVVAQEVRWLAAPSSACPRPRASVRCQCPVRATSVHACLST